MVAAHFTHAAVLLGSEARGSAVAAGLPDAEVFHYSGHGFTAGGVTGVYLADSPLTPFSLHAIELRSCRLTVLSACLTAPGGGDAQGDSPSLVRAFLDAGSSVVIGSRWEVESRASLMLMTRFYAQFENGGDAAQSLRSAAAALRTMPRFAHPFYWGAWQIYM
jgi:CHAT domain-containing protein